MASNALNEAAERLAPLVARRDVQEDQLVSSLTSILSTELHGVANVPYVHEVDPLDCLPIAYVQAGDYSFCNHNGISYSAKISKKANP